MLWMLHCFCTVHRFTICWRPCGQRSYSTLRMILTSVLSTAHCLMSLLGQRQAYSNVHKLQIVEVFICCYICLSSKCLESQTVFLYFQVQKLLESRWSQVLLLLHSSDDPDMNQDYLFYIDLLVRPRSGLF